jgi:hypothetical protein
MVGPEAAAVNAAPCTTACCTASPAAAIAPAPVLQSPMVRPFAAPARDSAAAGASDASNNGNRAPPVRRRAFDPELGEIFPNRDIYN